MPLHQVVGMGKGFPTPTKKHYMRGGEPCVHPHVAIATPLHVKPQPRWLVDLQHPRKRFTKMEAATQRLAQLQNELQRRVPDMAAR